MSEETKITWLVIAFFTVGIGCGIGFDSCALQSKNCFTAKTAVSCDIFSEEGTNIHTVSWPYPEDKEHMYCSVPDIMVRCKGTAGEPVCFQKINQFGDDIYNFPEWGICPAPVKAEAEPTSTTSTK